MALFTLLLLTLICITPFHVWAEPPLRITNLDVNAEILDNGVLVYELSFNASSELNGINLRIPAELSANLLNYSFTPLSALDKVVLESDVITMEFKRPLNAFKIYIYALVPVEVNGTIMHLVIPSCLDVPFAIDLLNFTLKYPDAVKPTSVEVVFPSSAMTEEIANVTVTHFTLRSLPPHNVTSLIADVSAGISWPIVEELTRVVIVEGEWCTVEENYLVNNLGTSAVSSLSFWLPNNVTDVEVRGLSATYIQGNYAYGSFTLTPSANSTLLSVKPWYPLGSRERLYVKIKYRTRAFLREDNDKRLLVITPLWRYQMPIVNIKLIIKASDYVNLINVESERGNLVREGDSFLLNVRGVIGPLHGPLVKVSYSVNTLNVVLANSRLPLSIIGLLAVTLVLGYLIPKQLQRPGPTPKPEFPPVVEDLLNALDEYVALRMEERELEDSYAKRRLRYAAYRGRKERLSSEVEKVQRRVQELALKVKEDYPHVKEDVDRALAYLRRLDSEVKSIVNLERRLRSKRLTRDEYRRLITRYNKSLDRTLSRINSALINIRDKFAPQS